MSTITILRPDADPEERDIGKLDPVKAASSIINDTMDFTRVRWNGKLRTMAVGDTSSIDGSAYNKLATEAYMANCKEGAMPWHIGGIAVVFEKVLS